VHASGDQSEGYFHWWPQKGTTEWVEYAFPRAVSVSEVTVHWYDDTGHGECRVPASWRLLSKTSDGWTPVDARSTYGTQKDSANRVPFAPVLTTGLRMEVTLQPSWSAGILEWSVGAQP